MTVGQYPVDSLTAVCAGCALRRQMFSPVAACAGIQSSTRSRDTTCGAFCDWLIYPPDSVPTMMKMPKFQTPPAVTKAMQNARVYGMDAMDTAGVLWQKHKPETIVGYTVWLLSRSRTQLELQLITICSWHRRHWLEAACWDWR